MPESNFLSCVRTSLGTAFASPLPVLAHGSSFSGIARSLRKRWIFSHMCSVWRIGPCFSKSAVVVWGTALRNDPIAPNSGCVPHSCAFGSCMHRRKPAVLVLLLERRRLPGVQSHDDGHGIPGGSLHWISQHHNHPGVRQHLAYLGGYFGMEEIKGSDVSWPLLVPGSLVVGGIPARRLL